MWFTASMRRCSAAFVLLTLAACDAELDEESFRRAAEKAYAEVHPGWTIYRREEGATVFVRGDQLDRLEVDALWARYEGSGLGGRSFFSEWKEEARREVEARKRTLAEARRTVIPLLKSDGWVRVQDLAAIGPERIQKDIRPWRREVTDGLFVVLGVPEEKLGLRIASIREVETSTVHDVDGWVQQAIGNLERQIPLARDAGVEVRRDDGLLLAVDLPNADGVSGLILSQGFREHILKRFNKPSIGAAAPLRNVLILFEPEEFTAKKPVRARAHQLYDTQNHPAFRGLLLLEPDRITVLEPGRPAEKPDP
jgi:hypothetical protein